MPRRLRPAAGKRLLSLYVDPHRITQHSAHLQLDSERKLWWHRQAEVDLHDPGDVARSASRVQNFERVKGIDTVDYGDRQYRCARISARLEYHAIRWRQIGQTRSSGPNDDHRAGRSRITRRVDAAILVQRGRIISGCMEDLRIGRSHWNRRAIDGPVRRNRSEERRVGKECRSRWSP